MDALSLAFYAAICAALSGVSPRLGGLPARLGIGALVGIAAAAGLPIIRGLIAAP